MGNYFLGLITSIIIVLIALIFKYKTGWFIGKKKLVANLVSISSLASVSGKLDKHLTLHWKGQALDIPEVYQLTIQIINAGTKEIRPEDFETPINVIVDTEAILSSGLTSQPDVELNLNWTIKDNTIVIEPLLLNAEDAFTISLLVNGYGGFEVTGRIAGVKSIEKEYTSQLFSRQQQQVSVVMLIIILAIVLGVYAYVLFLVELGRPLPPSGNDVSMLKIIFCRSSTGYESSLIKKRITYGRYSRIIIRGICRCSDCSHHRNPYIHLAYT